MKYGSVGTLWIGSFAEYFPQMEEEAHFHMDLECVNDMVAKWDEGIPGEVNYEEEELDPVVADLLPQDFFFPKKKRINHDKKYRKVKIIDDSYSWGEAGEYLDPSRKKTEKEKKQVRKNKKWLDLICKASDLEACQKWLAYGNDFCKYGSVREFRIREAERIITKETNL